ncbi:MULTISPECIES: NAD-dependent succinate-semialdehyde dehydrogenase [Rhodobacterales]|uniref:Alpha-ketoglutaric semialdehyde dehydrogenase n=2 Tax=Rhodobacterales TaxID=204455 RepID=A0A2R8B157_9RHOB|nr:MULTISPECIES: NAD-dependent succinate-semialdehyde dehydrogenase [Rhodobacterales]TMV89838.1 NAD-dependent succinate-semialdehyde dehydrogenase [Thioclava sp. BHET1]SPF82012.1 Alpha-ketoglutaric semialdehyde dehydrogenase [Pseudoprimorskyibacter insulae]
MNYAYSDLCLYIDGRFIGSDERSGESVYNPANGQILGHLPHATTEDLDLAIAAADRAFQKWRWTSPIERSRVLRKVASLIRERSEDIARNLTLDQGKPLAEARVEILGAADHADWHAEECRRIYGRVIPSRDPSVRQTVVRQPVGVCASFSPWNYPLNQALRKICAALGSGCTIVLKASEDAPSAVVALAHIFHDAGLPAGCLNVVWGVPAKVSEHLITSPKVRKISFTGSIPVGKHLAAMAGAHMKRATMELGGHSPVLVFDDADIDKAATLLAGYKGLNAGQVCMSPSRFFVHEKVAQEFGEKFAAAFGSRVVGDGMHSDTTMGPLAHTRRVSAMTEFVSDATAKGASILTGGTAISGPGNFFPPTVLMHTPDTAKIMIEEPFGPVAPISTFSETDEVLSRANALPFGLASYVFTKSLRTSHYVTSKLEAGMVNVNHFGIALPETPLGGVKDSGMGSEGGSETFDAYLATKFISEATE